MNTFFKETLLLMTCFIIIMIWQIYKVESWTTPLLSILTGGYLFSIHAPFLSSKQRESSAFFFITLTILILINVTGGTLSPFFFLLFFLLFYLAFIFSPSLVFLFIIGTLIIFIPEPAKTIDSVMKIASLGLFSPLAYFFGKASQERKTQQEELQSIHKNALLIKETEGKNLLKENRSRLEEIITDTNS